MSWVLYLATTITWTVFSKVLYITLNAGSTGSFLGAVNAYLKQYAHALNANLATYYCTWTSLYIIKLSFMIFFHSLGNNLRAQRILWWTVLFFIVASYAISVGMFDYGCLTSDWKHIIGEYIRWIKYLPTFPPLKHVRHHELELTDLDLRKVC